MPPPVPHVAATPTQQTVPLPTAVPGEPLAARVNGQPIYLQDYQKQVSEWEEAFVSQNPSLSQEDREAMLVQGRQQVLDVMIEQVLIEQSAAQEGLIVSDQDVESVIARDVAENGGQEQFNTWLQANNWTAEEYAMRQRSMMIASQMFERVTRNVPTKAEQIHARHILVATEQQARDLVAQLQSGADFVALASQSSLDPSTKDSGGDLGFFPRGTLVVPEIEDVAFALDVGQISDVVKSAMGYHIVQVLERVQDMVLTEESWQALKETTFRKWVAELWAAADIEVLISV
ncbi:MAG: peptidylprolyl isomerase [Anaerolineae bacterium]|nr:peptidylprolyl isomerase [Anaerolineae bacterium]